MDSSISSADWYYIGTNTSDATTQTILQVDFSELAANMSQAGTQTALDEGLGTIAGTTVDRALSSSSSSFAFTAIGVGALAGTIGLSAGVYLLRRWRSSSSGDAQNLTNPQPNNSTGVGEVGNLTNPQPNYSTIMPPLPETLSQTEVMRIHDHVGPTQLPTPASPVEPSQKALQYMAASRCGVQVESSSMGTKPVSTTGQVPSEKCDAPRTNLGDGLAGCSQQVKYCALAGLGLTAACCSAALMRLLWKQTGKRLSTCQAFSMPTTPVAHAAEQLTASALPKVVLPLPKLAQQLPLNMMLPPPKPVPLASHGPVPLQMVTNTAEYSNLASVDVDASIMAASAGGHVGEHADVFVSHGFVRRRPATSSRAFRILPRQ